MGYAVTDMTMTKNYVIANGVALLLTYAVDILLFRLIISVRLLPCVAIRLTPRNRL